MPGADVASATSPAPPTASPSNSGRRASAAVSKPWGSPSVPGPRATTDMAAATWRRAACSRWTRRPTRSSAPTT
jgi:hypothetical protein